jgi:hypothetical protein
MTVFRKFLLGNCLRKAVFLCLSDWDRN